MKLVFIILSLLLSTSIFGQPISKTTQQLVDQIAEYNTYNGGAVGVAGSKTEQWGRFEQLKKQATAKELMALCDHKNAVVRCYAFEALAERQHPQTFDILLQHLQDTEKVEILQGCIAMHHMVGDFFMSKFAYSYQLHNGQTLPTAQKDQLDSILLFDKSIQLFSKTSIFQNLPPKEQYYKRVKTIAKKDKSSPAILALAKYKKEEDLALFIQYLLHEDPAAQNRGLEAVQQFPHPDFFPYLQTIQRQEIEKTKWSATRTTEALYGAIVQYKTPASKALLEHSLENAPKDNRTNHSSGIWWALTRYPAPIYKGIIEQISLPEPTKYLYEYRLEQFKKSNQ